jgi:general secretion pathway protein L
MLQEFITWYGQQMAAMLPSLGGRGGAVTDGLVVIAESLAARPPVVRLAQRRRGQETPLGRFVLEGAGLAAARTAIGGGRRGATVLRLPPGALLERVVTLPLAAEASLERVVEYEMDRYTPFAAEEVFWSVQARSRDRVQKRLQAGLTLVPRAGLAPLLGTLKQLGATPAELEGQAAGGGGLHRLPLAQRDARRARRERRMLLAAAAGCAVLAVAAAGVPFWRQAQAAQAIEDRIAALQPNLAAAEALRQKLSAEAAGSDAIQAEQALVGEPLQAIAALTQILPDDTFLTALVLQKRQLSIEGQSANAARLIGSLSIDPVIRNAAFAAPVTRSDTGADLFSIKAEVRP